MQVRAFSCTAVAAFVVSTAGAASAQVFNHNIGQPAASADELLAEFFEDLTLYNDQTIAGYGDRIPSGPGIQSPLLVFHTPDGVPVRSWVFDAFITTNTRASGVAVRRATIDADVLLLNHFAVNALANFNRMNLTKFDPIAGTPVYSWSYLGDTRPGEPWGMEVRGESGFVAGAAPDPNIGRIGSLLRYDQTSGLPLFFNAYQPFAPQTVRNLGFVDVALGGENQSIYAVGTVDLQDPAGLPPQRRLVIASFDNMGFPNWIRGYGLFFPNEDLRDISGVSIEVNDQGLIAVTARTQGATAGSPAPASAAALIVDPAGNPVDARLYVTPDRLDFAYASLDRLNDGTLLASGTRGGGAAGSTSSPVMLALDPFSADIIWYYRQDPDAGRGRGFDAIAPAADAPGPILGGQVIPADFPPFAFDADALLVRTRPNGEGLCPFDDFPEPVQPEIRDFDIFVETFGLSEPVQQGIEARELELEFREVCDELVNTCIADFNNDGQVDGADFGIFGAAFGSMCGDPNYFPPADFNNDCVIDGADFGVFGSEFGRTDCFQ